MADNNIRVRLAPSPTGFLHVGTAQSALYNYLFAKQQGGQFFVRIEDTDKERSTKEYETSILEALEWLNLKWDGAVVRQSERSAYYQKSLKGLLAAGHAFYCHHSKEELEAEQARQTAAKEAPRHICEHKYTIEGKNPGGIIRLAVDVTLGQIITFHDMIRGPIEFQTALLGDFSIARSLDEPLYNFAVVVDDADMQITHVIRGEDHISNTPKQILIYKALGFIPPHFAHLPLMLAADRSKLSKRHGATAVVDFKKDYLPEALVNFLGTLSFTFSNDIIDRGTMIREFDLAKVHKSGAIFDIKKLNWINSQYIKHLSVGEFKALSGMPGIPDRAAPLITERLEKLTDVHEFSYLWQEPVYQKELLCWKDSPFKDVKQSLSATLEIIKKSGVDKEDLMAQLDSTALELGNKGLVYWPLRVALSGKEKSPGPVEIAEVLGKEETLRRIQNALLLLN